MKKFILIAAVAFIVSGISAQAPATITSDSVPNPNPTSATTLLVKVDSLQVKAQKYNDLAAAIAKATGDTTTLTGNPQQITKYFQTFGTKWKLSTPWQKALLIVFGLCLLFFGFTQNHIPGVVQDAVTWIGNLFKKKT